MNLPAFWRGAGMALLLSGSGTLAFMAFAPLLAAGSGLKALTLVLGFAYLLMLMTQHRARAGRLACLTAWVCSAVLLQVLDPALSTWLLVQVSLVWLLRCLYVHDSLRAALLDAALSALAVAAAFATALHTGSLFLSLWSFFLTQALHVLIPARRSAEGDPPTDAAFERAEHVARSALERITSRRRQEYPS